MHEVGIVNGILDTVIRAARGAGASRAVLVTLRIGDMTEVVREALDFAWETFRDEDPLTRGCELAVEEVHPQSECLTAVMFSIMTASTAAAPSAAAPMCAYCTVASSTSPASRSKLPTINQPAIWGRGINGRSKERRVWPRKRLISHRRFCRVMSAWQISCDSDLKRQTPM